MAGDGKPMHVFRNQSSMLEAAGSYRPASLALFALDFALPMPANLGLVYAAPCGKEHVAGPGHSGNHLSMLPTGGSSTLHSTMPSSRPAPRARAGRHLPREISEQARVLRAAVCRNVGPPWANRIVWSRCKIPTISNIDILRDCPIFASGLGPLLLHDSSRRTAFEQPGASWDSAIARLDRELPRPDILPSLLSMASTFVTHVLPMAREPSTRDGHWRNWRSVVTWAIAHGATQRLLPIRLDVLQALSWQLLSLRCGPAHLQSVWAAIAQRHREAGLRTPWTPQANTAAGCMRAP